MTLTNMKFGTPSADAAYDCAHEEVSEENPGLPELLGVPTLHDILIPAAHSYIDYMEAHGVTMDDLTRDPLHDGSGSELSQFVKGMGTGLARQAYDELPVDTEELDRQVAIRPDAPFMSRILGFAEEWAEEEGIPDLAEAAGDNAMMAWCETDPSNLPHKDELWRGYTRGLVTGVAWAMRMGVCATPEQAEQRRMDLEGSAGHPQKDEDDLQGIVAEAQAVLLSDGGPWHIDARPDASESDHRIARYLNEVMFGALKSNISRIVLLLSDRYIPVGLQEVGSLLFNALRDYMDERVQRGLTGVYDSNGGEPLQMYADQWLYGFIAHAMGDRYEMGERRKTTVADTSFVITPDMTIGMADILTLVERRCEDRGYPEVTMRIAQRHIRSYYVFRQAMSAAMQGLLSIANWEGVAFGFTDGWEYARAHGLVVHEITRLMDEHLTKQRDIEQEFEDLFDRMGICDDKFQGDGDGPDDRGFDGGGQAA